MNDRFIFDAEGNQVAPFNKYGFQLALASVGIIAAVGADFETLEDALLVPNGFHVEEVVEEPVE